MVKPHPSRTVFRRNRLMTFANHTIKRRCDTAIQDGLELIGFFEAEALWHLAATSRLVVDRLRAYDFHAAWQLLASADFSRDSLPLEIGERQHRGFDYLISLRSIVRFLVTDAEDGAPSEWRREQQFES